MSKKLLSLVLLLSMQLFAEPDDKNIEPNAENTTPESDIDKKNKEKQELLDFLKFLEELEKKQQNAKSEESESEDTEPVENKKNKPKTKFNLEDLLKEQEDNRSEEKLDKAKFLSPYSNLKTEELPQLEAVFYKGIPYELSITIARLKANELGNRKHGIVLYGPPGTGKTTTAELIARATERRVIFCNGSDFINKYQGSGAEGIKSVFDYAKSLNQPVVIIIDEIDAASAKKKDTEDNPAVSNSANDMVTQFINQMNLIEDRSDIFVIGTTNHEDIIEGAIKSRFDFVKVDNPDHAQRIEIIKYHLKRGGYSVVNNISKGVDKFITLNTVKDLASKCDGWDCRNIMAGINNGLDAYKYNIELNKKRSLLKRFMGLPTRYKISNKAKVEQYLYKSFEDQEDRKLGDKKFWHPDNIKKEFKKNIVPLTVNSVIMSAIAIAARPLGKLTIDGLKKLKQQHRYFNVLDYLLPEKVEFPNFPAFKQNPKPRHQQQYHQDEPFVMGEDIDFDNPEAASE